MEIVVQSACGAQISARPKSRAQCRVLAPQKTSGHRVKCAYNCRSVASGAKSQLQSKEQHEASQVMGKEGKGAKDARCELGLIRIATKFDRIVDIPHTHIGKRVTGPCRSSDYVTSEPGKNGETA